MNQEELFNKMLELAPSEYNDVDFLDHCRSLFERYVSLLRDYEPQGEEIQGKIRIVIEKAEGYCNALLSCIEDYYKGLLSQSYLTLKGCLDSLPKWKAAHKFSTYRMRVVEEGTMPTFEGMFHIPYEKRGIIKTQRYSVPGLPCLYLGFTPYTCWFEMEKPELDRTYLSRYQPNDFYMYLPFCLPEIIGWKEGKLANRKFLDDLLYFPFVIVSMVKVAKKNVYFKPEYIIPQMIVQWLLEGRTPEDNPMKKPIGVMYTSVHYDKNKAKENLAQYKNLAIPCYYQEEKKYSQSLAKMFMYTDPVRCDDINRDVKPITDIEKDAFLTLLTIAINDEKHYPLKSLNQPTS